MGKDVVVPSDIIETHNGKNISTVNVKQKGTNDFMALVAYTVYQANEGSGERDSHGIVHAF